MKKLLLSLIVLPFAFAVGTASADKHMNEAIAKACKDKKPGTEVTVDGKKVMCPEPKK